MKRWSILSILLLGVAAGAGLAWADRASGAGRKPAPASVELVGLWAVDTVLGPALRGPLTLTRAPGRGEWTARIGSDVAHAAGTGDSLRLLFPGQGELRGRVGEGDWEVRGFWVQPAGPVLGAAYASPLTLRRTAPGRWQGRVTPLDDRFELFLTVRATGGDSLAAVFRDPEAGIRLGAPRFTLTAAGDSLHFVAMAAPGKPPVRFAGVYDRARGTIVVPVSELGIMVRLVPRPPSAAPGSRPRDPASPPYVYREPASLADGWPVAAAHEVGLDEAILTGLVRRFAAQDPFADSAPAVHSFLVERHGKLVLDEYFYGFDRERQHDLRSASKTFTGTMIGAAQARGAAIDTATPVYALFGGYDRFAGADPRKAAITVADLLTHTSGLACDDNDDASPGNEGTMQSQTAQPDWYRFALDLPLANTPGTHYAYCSAGMNLAGGALARATGAWLPALFDTLVARPLGLARYYVNLMPTGQAYSGGGMYLRPRDLLKFGELYLRRGAWQGRRVVSHGWAEQSVAPRVRTGAGSGDGLAWHTLTLRAGGRDYREYEANGNGGQFLIVLPDLDMAVVFTAGDYNRYGIWRRLRDDIVTSGIIPAASGPSIR